MSRESQVSMCSLYTVLLPTHYCPILLYNKYYPKDSLWQSCRVEERAVEERESVNILQTSKLFKVAAIYIGLGYIRGLLSRICDRTGWNNYLNISSNG